MERKLGRSNINVSAMGMGCWAIGGVWTWDSGGPAGWGVVDDNESIAAVHAALDHGITFFDTAANYGAGHSEVILAKALKDRREKAFVATKFGYNVDEAAKDVKPYGEDSSTADVITPLRDDLEASLRRLDTDVIDLLQFHVNEYNPEKAAAVRDALEGFVQEGKIRYYGWSTDNPAGTKVFAQGEHCVAIQHNLNVIHNSADIIGICEAENLACINRGPLGMGMLTGKYTKDTKFTETDVRNAEWVQENFFHNILDNLPKIHEVLMSDGRTLAQGALAWLWGRSDTTIPIPGIRIVAQAEENAKAMQFGPLTADQMAEVQRLLGRA